MKNKNVIIILLLLLSSALVLANEKSFFFENKGQVTGEDAQRVNYVYKTKGLSVFLLNNAIVYQFNKIHFSNKFLDAEIQQKYKKNISEQLLVTETYRIDITLIDANLNSSITAHGKSNDFINYYQHNSLNVYSYNKITYHNIYPNIDWEINISDGNLKYNFIVHPGGDPSQIKMHIDWAEEVKLNKDGSLVLKTSMGEISEKSPISFQGKKIIQTAFKVHKNNIFFSLNNYNPNQTLIIDPNVVWATYYGGVDYEEGNSCVTDINDNVYLAGSTFSLNAIAAGGHQNTFGGGANWDAFLVKFNSGGQRLWATYYGASGEDRGYSCTTDSLGNIYLVGGTKSNDSIAITGHQNVFAGNKDAFLVKFDSNGVRQWATYYGGTDEDAAYSCSIDKWGNVFMAGYTKSTNSIAFSGYQNSHGGNGNEDAFLVKFNSNGFRKWASYYGGAAMDKGIACSTDKLGNVYLTGEAMSSTAISSPGAHQTIKGGYSDAFLVKFDSIGNRKWATYYGAPAETYGNSCSVDDFGNVYMAGVTNSSNAIGFNGYQNYLGGPNTNNAFLVKFDSTGIRKWGTYYGGDATSGESCVTDNKGNVYLSGGTKSTYLIAYNGHQNVYGGGYEDAFIVKFDSIGARQWASYYGGSVMDNSYSCAVDSKDHVYIAGSTSSGNNIAFNGHQNNFGGQHDAFLTKSKGSTGIGLNELNLLNNSFSIFPNPASHITNIKTENHANNIYTLQVVDVLGKVIYSKKFMTETNIDISNFSKGIYSVYLTDEKSNRTVKKLIVH